MKLEYNKRRLSRDLVVTKEMLSLKSREGKYNCGIKDGFFFFFIILPWLLHIELFKQFNCGQTTAAES